MSGTSKSATAVAAMALAGVAACGGGAGAGAGGGGGGEEDAPIMIGVSAEFSGGAAEGGESILCGVESAVAIVNDEGGINGRPVELVTRDTEMDPSRGVSVVRELAADDDIIGVVGGYLSTVALAQAPIIAQEQLPWIVATSNVPASVELAMPWAYGVRMNANVTAQYARDFAEEHFDATKWAVLYESGGYGQAGLEAMNAALEEVGSEPVAAEVFNLDDRDMSSQVSRAQSAGADAVYLFGIGASNGYVLREMERIGWDPVVIGEMGAAQSAVAEVAGAGADGTYVIQTANFESEQERPAAAEMLQVAEEECGGVPAMPAPTAQGHDAALLLMRAIESVDLTGDVEADRAAVRDALESLDEPVEGAIATWEEPFSAEDHDAVTPDDYLMNVWRDGELLVAEEQ